MADKYEARFLFLYKDKQIYLFFILYIAVLKTYFIDYNFRILLFGNVLVDILLPFSCQLIKETKYSLVPFPHIFIKMNITWTNKIAYVLKN